MFLFVVVVVRLLGPPGLHTTRPRALGKQQATVLFFFALGLAAVGATGGVAAVVVFAFAVALLRFSLTVSACCFDSEYSTDLPVGHFNQLVTSAPCPEIAGGAGSVEVPTQRTKCNTQGVLDGKVWRCAPSQEEQCVEECVRIPGNDAVMDVRRREGRLASGWQRDAPSLSPTHLDWKTSPRATSRVGLSVAGLASARE